MHELGIVVYVLDQVEALIQEKELPPVSKVTLMLGEVSGIIPDYLEDCFKWARARYPGLETSVLACEMIEAKTLCLDCQHEYRTLDFGKTCPHCHSTHTQLKQGNEALIKEIAVEERRNE